MAEHRVTFPLRLDREHHPEFIAGRLDFEPDPNGWVAVEAEDCEQARQAAFALLGQAWAFVYPEPFGDDWSELYPKGELARIGASAVLEKETPACSAN